MKKIIYLLILVALLMVKPALGQQRDLNPTKDPDIQRGIEQNQERYRQRQETQQRQETKSQSKSDRSETDRGRRPNDPNGVEIDQSTWKTPPAKP
jgi:hypothetical protein